MNVTLEIVSPSAVGRTVAVPPGGRLVVGRSAECDVSVPADEYLSGRHFAIEWRGATVIVRDLGSSNGTLVNAERVTERAAQNGDVIAAGDTTFRVLIDDGVVAAGITPRAQPWSVLSEGRLQPLYAVLDAARDPRVLELLQKSAAEHQSLYGGPQADGLAGVAPYLVACPVGAQVSEALVREASGKSWGVFAVCDRPFREVRKHLRQFLIVKLESGPDVYFRFYDPRVLRTFLPTCTREELDQFFGPITRLLVEEEGGARLLEFARPE